MRDEEQAWTAAEWARWWLDRGRPAGAAECLRPWDEVEVTPEELPALAAALAARGLRAVYADGTAFVHTPEEAARIEADILRESAREATGSRPARKPPARNAPEGARQGGALKKGSG
jgi:hypothetical protein